MGSSAALADDALGARDSHQQLLLDFQKQGRLARLSAQRLNLF